MSENWESFLEGLKSDSLGLLNKELEGFIQSAKQDPNTFIKEQGKKLDRYLTQLAMKQITKDDFALLMQDLKDVSEAEALKMEVGARARTQRIVTGVTDLILNRLLRILP